ncbi:hypothetical protein ACJIZ3_001685 [Penstemon smallii]|uniref:Uncharacterized protein n=1 Tax=Penstemon smallii TaxID=265156 RepID=A0ABD3U7F6_9LAMI
MSIRFKFRSAANFDTVEIGNRDSISVRELRAKILGRNNSQKQQQGFDLVFSDAVSALVYKGDDSQIPIGSSVIVKRVPGGTVPSVPTIEAEKDNRVKTSHTLNQDNGPVDEFKYFGVDLCSIPDSELPQFDLEMDVNNIIVNEKEDIAGLRLECQELGSSDISQANKRGSNQIGNGKNIIQEARVVRQMELNKLSTSKFLGVQCTNMPLELKCSLCNTFFKEAVMIPCCQHSFCDKCIRLVLIEKGRCPKCFSSKCNVENLLPNLSLRQAIVHFLESQMLDADKDNAMQKYAPDGESAIQAKDVSCALTVVQRELEMPQSSCATGKGSNQVMTESYYDHPHQRNVPSGNTGDRNIKSVFPSQKLKEMEALNGGYPYQRGSEDLTPSTGFQGENQPVVLPQTNVHGEADFNSKRKVGFWNDTGGGDRNFLALGGHKKGIRNCYICGSPDHLMRDCPASNQNLMFQHGNGAFHGGMPSYAPPYWNGSSLPPFGPYGNMYGHPAALMMPFNASFPVSPFAVPPYNPSVCGGMPGPGNMRMGTMRPPRHSEYFDFGLQPCENSRKHSNENHGRVRLSGNEDGSPECSRNKSPKHLHDYKSQKHREPSLSYSGDSSIRRSNRYVDERREKGSHSSFAGRDKRHHTRIEEAPRSSDRQKHHHVEPKKYHERRDHYDSDSSLGNHSTGKDVKRRVESDVRGPHRKHHSRSESSFEPSSPVDRREHKGRDIGHDCRHSRHSAKHLGDRRHDDRDEYHHHKRKRVC